MLTSSNTKALTKALEHVENCNKHIQSDSCQVVTARWRSGKCQRQLVRDTEGVPLQLGLDNYEGKCVIYIRCHRLFVHMCTGNSWQFNISAAPGVSLPCAQIPAQGHCF